MHSRVYCLTATAGTSHSELPICRYRTAANSNYLFSQNIKQSVLVHTVFCKHSTKSQRLINSTAEHSSIQLILSLPNTNVAIITQSISVQ